MWKKNKKDNASTDKKSKKEEENDKEEESNEINTQIQLNANIDDLLAEKKEEMKKEEEELIEKARIRKEIQEKQESKIFYNEAYIRKIEELESTLNKLQPGESRLYEYGDRLIQCWKCQQLNLVKAHWIVIECSNCRHYCKLEPKIDPLRTISSNVVDSPSSPDPLSLNTRVPCIFTIITCPFCRAQNKLLTSEKELKCFVCKRVWTIIKPEKKPKEEDCYSYDPQSRYYKFNHKKDPVYPPINSSGISDLFFPDPVIYNIPANPLINYHAPYQELETNYYQRRIMRENDSKGIEYQYNNRDRKYLVAKIKDIDFKVTSAIEGIQSERKFRERQNLSQSQNYNDRINSYQKTFLMKK